MASFGVTLRGFHFEDWQFTFLLAAGITSADVGKAVALDPAAANTVKLAGDNDVVFGRLMTVENRAQQGILVGGIAIKFSDTLPIADGATFLVGSKVLGGGAGAVKPVSNPTGYERITVLEVQSGFVVVMKE